MNFSGQTTKTTSRNCYHKWSGKYETTTAGEGAKLTQEDINEAAATKHYFGCGQVVVAKLNGDVIDFFGECDSGD